MHKRGPKSAQHVQEEEELKIHFLMGSPEEKKHSTRFSFEAVEDVTIAGFDDVTPEVEKALKSASFYFPKPIGAKAKRLRVYIEEL